MRTEKMHVLGTLHSDAIVVLLAVSSALMNQQYIYIHGL